MYLVKKFTQLLEFTTALKLNKAEKRNIKAISGMKRAKRRMDKSSYEYKLTQAELLIQLNKLNKVEVDIRERAAITESKSAAINTILLENFSD